MNKKSLAFAILIALLIFSIITFAILNNKTKKEEVDDVKVVDKMEKYGYILEENETDYYKEKYEELKEVLNNDEVDFEKYARIVTQLFVSDLFTLSNKVSNRDIGGTQFVYKDYQSDFDKTEQSKLYSHVENNVYGDRTQELPTVSIVNITNLETNSFKYGDTDYEGYKISVSIDYEKDLSYPTTCTLQLIKNSYKIEVASLN